MSKVIQYTNVHDKVFAHNNKMIAEKTQETPYTPEEIEAFWDGLTEDQKNHVEFLTFLSHPMVGWELEEDYFDVPSTTH